MDEMERLIEALIICQEGRCSECKYTTNCMDGLIDDALKMLQEIHEQSDEDCSL